MEIKIQGYKNISNLNVNIEEAKLNIIVGMSGSGKSSIAESLQKERDLNLDKKVGFRGDVSVAINGKKLYKTVEVFNMDTLNDFIVKPNLNNHAKVYDVLIDNDLELEKSESISQNAFKDLLNAFQENEEQYNEFNDMFSKFGGKMTKTNELPKTAPISKLEQSVKKASSNSLIKYIQTLEQDQFKWLVEGINYTIADDKCPYCGNHISKKKLTKIKRLSDFNDKQLYTFNNEIEALRRISENIDFTTKGISLAKTRITEIGIALNDYKKLRSFVQQVMDNENETEVIECSAQFKKFFPKLYKTINTFKEKRIIYQGKARESLNKTKKILSRSLNLINDELEIMSIPYKVDAVYKNGKICKYELHLLGDNLNNRVYSLSSGEKNIIALLMFVLMCKKTNPDLVIIDDPASAYDDYRRNQVFEFIKKHLRGKTVIIMSHDSVFAKYAVCDKSNVVGKVLFFENNDISVNLSEITKEDFVDFDNCVIQHLKEISDYYQKIINLRMLYEGVYGSVVYGYVSAILHNKTKEEILDGLYEKNSSEERVIELIKNKCANGFLLEKYDYDNKSCTDIRKYSLIEKAFLIRELIPKNHPYKKQLDDLCHINRKLKVCLNPYKFNICTKNLKEFIDNFMFSKVIENSF